MRERVAQQPAAPAPARAPKLELPEKDAEQHAAQRAYLKDLRAGAAETSARAAPPPPAHHSRASQRQAGGREQKKSSGGVGGWFASAGDWIAGKAVGAYDWAAEKAAGAYETAKRVGSDAYQVATSSSASYRDGVMSLNTSATEAMDLLPGAWGEAVALDRRADNQVTLAFDTAQGTLTVTAPVLAISALNLGPFTSGAVTLTDVVLVLRNPGGGLVALDSKPDNLQAEVSVGGATAQAVRFEGPAGLLTVEQVTLAGLTAVISNPEGGVPLLDAAQDHPVGQFQLASAVLTGVGGPAARADQVSVSGAHGGVDTRTQAGWVAADGVTGAGVRGQGYSAAQVSATQMSAGYDGAHGTMGARAEHLSADVLKGPGGVSVAHLDASGARGRLEGPGQIEAHADRLSAVEAQGAVALRSGSATGLDVHVEGGAVRAEAHGVEAQGLRAGELRAGALSGTGLSVELGEHPGRAEAHVAQISGDQVAYGDTVAAEHLDVSDLAGHVQDGVGGITVGSARAQRVQVEGMSAGDLQVRGVEAEADRAGHGSVSARAVDAHAVATEQARLEALSARGLAVSRDARGVDGSVRHAEVKDLSGQGATAEALSVDGLSAHLGRDAQGRPQQTAAVDEIALDHARYGDARLDSARLTRATYGRDGAELRTGADHLSARGARLPGAHLDSLELQAPRTHHLGEQHTLSAAGVAARGFGGQAGRYSAQADLLSATEAKVGLNTGTQRFHASVASAGGQQLKVSAAGRDRADPLSTRGGYVSAGQVVRGLSGAVDRADAKLSAGLTPGKASVVTVPEDTRVEAQVKVRDGNLVPGETRARTTRTLDGPLWTGVNGARLEAAKPGLKRHYSSHRGRGGWRPGHGAARPAKGAGPQGRVVADVAGWFDKDLTKAVTNSMGEPRKTLPLSVATLGGMAADKVDRAREESRAAASPVGSRRSRLDLSDYQLDASAHLRAGRLNLGERQHLDLKQGERGGNTLNVRGRGGEELVVSLTQLLLGALSLQVGEKQVQAGETEVRGAQLKVGEDADRATTFEGQVDSFRTEDLVVD